MISPIFNVYLNQKKLDFLSASQINESDITKESTGSSSNSTNSTNLFHYFGGHKAVNQIITENQYLRSYSNSLADLESEISENFLFHIVLELG